MAYRQVSHSIYLAVQESDVIMMSLITGAEEELHDVSRRETPWASSQWAMGGLQRKSEHHHTSNPTLGIEYRQHTQHYLLHLYNVHV